MKTIQLYSRNDVVKSKLGTLFMISHVHDAMWADWKIYDVTKA